MLLAIVIVSTVVGCAPYDVNAICPTFSGSDYGTRHCERLKYDVEYVAPTEVHAPATAKVGKAMTLTAYVQERSSCERALRVDAELGEDPRTILVTGVLQTSLRPEEPCSDEVTSRKLQVMFTPTATGTYRIVGYFRTDVLATIEVTE